MLFRSLKRVERPKRNCAKQHAKPSAVHYVGYVEDEETPEMIMKKFEELEKVSHSSHPLRDSITWHTIPSYIRHFTESHLPQ